MEICCSKLIVTEVLVSNFIKCMDLKIQPVFRKKQGDYLLVFLITGGGSVLFGFLCQFLFQTTFTITMHLRFIAVFAKVFGYVFLIGHILCYYYNRT